MAVRSPTKKPARSKAKSDQLSANKVRISVAITRVLRKKLEKLAKVRHVTLSGCVVGLLETAYEDSLALSSMMDNSEVRHAIMLALDDPRFLKQAGARVFDRLSEEQDYLDQQIIPLVHEPVAKPK